MRRIASLALARPGLGDPGPGPGRRDGPRRSRVYVGTYTGPTRARGSTCWSSTRRRAPSTPKGVAAETPSPSFLAIHPSRKFLYAANEVGNFERQEGRVGLGVRDRPEDRRRSPPLNAPDLGRGRPLLRHRRPDRVKCVLVANYGGGSLEVLPIGADGKLGDPTALIQHKGSSVNKGRQAAPHAHSIDLDATGRLAVAADLGLDKLMVYRLDPETGTLDAQRPALRRDRPGLRPPPLRLPPRRPARLRHQRDGLDRHRPRLRPARAGPSPNSRRSRPASRTPPSPATRPPRSWSTPPAGSSTARTGATTRWRSSRSTPPRASSPRSATSRPAARPRGTSGSTRPASSSSPPTRIPTPSSSSGSTRRPACSSRSASRWRSPRRSASSSCRSAVSRATDR